MIPRRFFDLYYTSVFISTPLKAFFSLAFLPFNSLCFIPFYSRPDRLLFHFYIFPLHIFTIHSTLNIILTTQGILFTRFLPSLFLLIIFLFRFSLPSILLFDPSYTQLSSLYFLHEFPCLLYLRILFNRFIPSLFLFNHISFLVFLLFYTYILPIHNFLYPVFCTSFPVYSTQGFSSVAFLPSLLPLFIYFLSFR